MSLSRFDYYKYLFNVYGLGRGTITKSWRDPAVVDLTGLRDEPVKGNYPIDFSQDDVDNLLTDQNGIPMIDYTNLGKHYNPWFVGHIALGRFSKWKRSKKDSDLSKFKILADWFVKTGEVTSHGLTWYYHFDWFNNHNKPWRSGLSQAHAISTLLRAASIFQDKKYEESAQKALQEMIMPIESGGAAYNWPDDTISFEESIILPPSSVINGHLFSVIACWEASNYFKVTEYTDLAKKGWTFILNRSNVFDLGYWSRYSFQNIRNIPDIASFHYHDVHIAQLQVLAEISGYQRFQVLSDRFKKYQHSKSCRIRALWHKRIAKIL